LSWQKVSKQKEDQVKDGKMTIKDTLQQNGLTIKDATRQARARILKTPRLQTSAEQQPSPNPVIE
jgi:hypothetical protein